MAHYIAELIKDAETAKVEDRPAKLAKCADAILNFWERRHQLPNGKRPFEDWEPILRALESLDPTDDKPRYFRSPRMNIDNTKQNAETKRWLEITDVLDNSVKILIRYCLTKAAETAIDRSKGWIELAENAGMEDDIDLTVIRVIAKESDLIRVIESEDKTRKLIEDRINRLDRFKKMADDLASELRRQLKQTHISNGDS